MTNLRLRTVKIENPPLGTSRYPATFFQVAGFVRDAMDKGAEPVVGGGALEHKMGPNFFPPSLFAGCSLDMRLSTHEIFGPVVGVMKFDDADEALAISNRQASRLLSRLSGSLVPRPLLRRLTHDFIY